MYSRGASEMIVGRALKRNGKRDRIVLATKVHGRMDDGDVLIYEILDPGQPFELINNSTLGATGTYGLADVILGDFIILARPGPTYLEDVLQTYYISENDWLLADPLLLENQEDGIDINMISEPVPFDPHDRPKRTL